jgi:hypothetical protein
MIRGGSRGGAPGARPPLKLEFFLFFWGKIVIFYTKYPNNFRASLRNWEKILFFWRKIVIFHTNTPTIFAPPLGIGKKYDFWRKIVVFHTKYPKNFRASLRSAQLFISAPP